MLLDELLPHKRSIIIDHNDIYVIDDFDPWAIYITNNY